MLQRQSLTFNFGYSGSLFVLVFGYFCTARLGLMLDAVSDFATLVWFPTGLALACLLLDGPRLWPGIAIGAFLVNWSIGASLLTACGIAVGNTLEALVGAFLLRRVVRFDNRLERLRDVLGLVGFASPLSTALSATIGVFSLWCGGKVILAAVGSTWSAWWVGDMLGALLFAPLILVWATTPRVRKPAGFIELCFLFFTLTLAGELSFGALLRSSQVANASLVYLLFPPLIWAALRTGQRGAVTAMCSIAMLAIWHTVQNEGPFVRETLSESLLGLQTFMAIAGVTVLVMAAMVSERAVAERMARESQKQLKHAYEVLEVMIQQRTAALASTNEALRKEIEDHRRTEEALKQTAAEIGFLSDLVEQTTQPVAVTDFEGRLIRFNQAFQRLTGYTAEELRTMRYQELTPAHWHAVEQQYIATLMTTGSAIRYEKEYRRKDGGLVPLELVVDLYRNAQGYPEYLYAFVTDITERKQTEWKLLDAMAKLELANQELQTTQLQLIQAAKLESVGRLAAGVAHEVKNPLATLLIGIDLLSDHFVTPDKNVRVLLKDMNQAVKRADSVIRGLLDFSSTETLEMTEENLNSLIGQALVLVKHAIDRSHVRIVRNLAGNLPPLRLDRHKLEQVFVNVFMNAIQAMPTGGTLTITTSLRRLDTPGNDVGKRRTDHFRLGEIAVISDIEDTGVGIPEDKLAKVFDPFFTTKPPGIGTGLGLTVTKKIIELHGGVIRIKNRSEKGVQVTMMFHQERRPQNGQETNPTHR